MLKGEFIRIRYSSQIHNLIFTYDHFHIGIKLLELFDYDSEGTK